MELNMVLSPLISVVVNKAADSLIKQICRMRGLDENRNKLHQQLLAIQKNICDAEERAGESPAVKEWMRELEAAAHYALDVLDELQYEALRQNAISQRPSASVKQLIKGIFTYENPAVFRYQMSNKLTKLSKGIDAIATEMYKFNFMARNPAPIVARDTIPFVMESEVIGRDREKEQIVSELTDPQREKENISVLPIVGIGGLGKTTLTQVVYNDDRVKSHFQLLMWVCVSIDFNVANICKSIIELVGSKKGASASNKEELQCQLQEILCRKRYLLVLDDVWNEDREKWDELRALLLSGAGSGSVIIVTTRSSIVATIMETLPRHYLASLNDEDSWNLFARRAFGPWVEEPPEEVYRIGRKLVRNCCGLPLAVKALGSLMGSKRDVYEWLAISENNIFADMLFTGSVLPILKLSYDHLPSHIKQCFAFCAIFPKDYVIERETLIHLWMANDFILTDGSMENLEDEGRYIFNELHQRSFFQNIREEETCYGPIITCKMHDLMHDLAASIAGNKCSVITEPNYSSIVSNVHHLSIASRKSLGIINVLKHFPNVRTCLVQNNQFIEEKHSYLLKSSSLRALQLQQGCLLKKLRYMKHIRYLDLSRGKFETLPRTISTLYNLQMLKLSYSNIRELPREMRYMTNLRHLFLNGCFHLKRMPIGFGQLKCLQTLTKYVVDSGRGGSIRELNNVNLLCGHISLCGLEKIRDIEDAETVNLAAKRKLCSLKLEWDITNNKGATGNDQEVLKALTPHNKLSYLAINGYSDSNFPKWIKEASIIRNLKRLSLEDCINCAELPPVWQLPLLESLYLYRLKSLIYIVGGMSKNVEGSGSLIIFPSLKILEVMFLSNLESWHEENYELVAFPKLNRLIIHDCPKLVSVPAHAPLLAILRVTNSNDGIGHPNNIFLKPPMGHMVNEASNFGRDDGIEKVVEEDSLKKCLEIGVSFVGREDDKNRIFELILANNSNDQIPNIVSVVADRGTGRTTILNLIYNDERASNAFNSRRFICMPEKFDDKDLMRVVIQSVSRAPCNSADIEVLKEIVIEELRDNKVLLLLDNFENRTQKCWELLSMLLSVCAKGSCLVVTATQKTVTEVRGPMHFYYLNHLCDEWCWYIFKEGAFCNQNPNANSDLLNIGKHLVAKCRNIVLCIKAISGLVRHSVTIDWWRAVLDSDFWEVDEVEGDILPALRLCYEFLPQYLKKCFKYCSLFPKEHIFLKQQLVLMWLSQGFIEPDESKELESIGLEYFDELLSRSFFQPSLIHDIKEEKFMMPSLAHDLAQILCKNEYFRSEGYVQQEHVNACHLSLVPHEFQSVSLKHLTTGVHNLQTLLVLNTSTYLDEGISPSILNLVELDDLFKTCMNLTMLKLDNTDIAELPGSIMLLTNLRFLGLSNTNIKKIPREVSSLIHLQTLEAKDCHYLEELHGTIEALTNLRYLDVTKESGYVLMPCGIGKLTNLRRLATFNVGMDSLMHCGIEELKDMVHLKGCLEISGIVNVRSGIYAKEALIRSKSEIEALSFNWSDGKTILEENEGAEIAEEVLQNLHPHDNLKEMVIRDYPGNRFPIWMESSYFLNLVSVILDHCYNCKSLPDLGGLPFLRFFSIQKMYSVQTMNLSYSEIIPENSTRYPSLEQLNIWEMYELMDWVEVRSQDFPRLRSLSINKCFSLRNIPKFSSLVELSIYSCTKFLEHMDLPSLQSLRIGGLQKIEFVRLPKNQVQLKKMEINHCPELVSIEGLSDLNSPVINVVQCPKFDLQGSLNRKRESTSVLARGN